jgi:hypothetical protein
MTPRLKFRRTLSGKASMASEQLVSILPAF